MNGISFEMTASACPAFSCCYSLLALTFRPPTAPSDRPPTELFGFGVGQVQFAHAFARIGKRDADRCSLTIRDFVARLVRYANRLSCHSGAPYFGGASLQERK
jgi:hypothetical protein